MTPTPHLMPPAISACQLLCAICLRYCSYAVDVANSPQYFSADSSKIEQTQTTNQKEEDVIRPKIKHFFLKTIGPF